jgi:hypothetical protein
MKFVVLKVSWKAFLKTDRSAANVIDRPSKGFFVSLSKTVLLHYSHVIAQWRSNLAQRHRLRSGIRSPLTLTNEVFL